MCDTTAAPVAAGAAPVESELRFQLLEANASDLRRQLAWAREALAIYTVHKPACPKTPCSCGLSAALARQLLAG